jgi:hypothetical protein
VHWHNPTIIQYSAANQSEWDNIWDKHHELRNNVLYLTNQEPEDRSDAQKELDHYLAKLSISGELGALSL